MPEAVPTAIRTFLGETYQVRFGLSSRAYRP